MLSPKVVSLYGYISIIIMAVLLGLIFFEKVPRSFYFIFFIVALVLFLGRIALRMLLARQERRSKSTQEAQNPK
jgi:FlaA1/EpsC-like NDP-sugar epimerase